MNIYFERKFLRLVLGLISFITLVSFVESARYTSKELEDLRKFYYDDVDNTEASNESTKDNNNNSRHKPSQRHESRSSFSSGRQKENKNSRSKESSDKDDSDEIPSPVDFFKDARKFLDQGRKNIEQEARKMLPPLPKIRTIRTIKFWKMKGGGRPASREEEVKEPEEDADEDAEEPKPDDLEEPKPDNENDSKTKEPESRSSISAFPTEETLQSPPHKKTNKNSEDDESQLEDFENEMTRIVKEAAEVFLEALEKKTSAEDEKK